jgi:hyperosmotically inducible periplasmic protein
MLPFYEVFDHITYRVDGNTVILSGKVLNASNKKGAEHAVKRIDGVVNVVNNIEYLPFGGYDDTIRRQLYANIANMAGLSRYLHPVNPDIRLIVERGNVTLEGYVSNQTDANLARIAANSVPGVFTVTNNLVIDKRAG